MEKSEPWGAGWRSSSGFIMFTVIIGLFCQSFFYSYIVPILEFMLERRLQLPAAQTQKITNIMLMLHGGFAVVMTPILTYFVNKTPHRKIPLLIGLFWCFIGTSLIAFATSLWILILGRTLQAIAGCACWIISFATVDDHVNSACMGKAVGAAFTFFATAILTGPVISGLLLQFAGYWATWSVPLTLLMIGFIARLIMLEETNLSTALDERNSLLGSSKSSRPSSRSSNFEIHHTVKSVTGFLVGLLNIMMEGFIGMGFDATIPIFLRRQFGMKTAEIGLILVALQAPGIIMSPVVSLLRSNIGLKVSTTVGWGIMALLLWLLGTLGEDLSFDIATSDIEVDRGNRFIWIIIFIGFVAAIIRGAGMLQMKEIISNTQAVNSAEKTRMYSLAEIGFNSGASIGPLVCGYVFEVFGFSHMTSTMDEFLYIIKMKH